VTQLALAKGMTSAVKVREVLVRAKPWEVPDALWQRIEPLLPTKPRRFRYPGRKPLDDRRVLQGILFVLHTGIGWEHLPQELGFGCGMTAWRRLRDWQRAGVWEKLHQLLLAELHTPISSSGSGLSPTSATCRRKRGRQDGVEPGRPGPPGEQAPPARRWRRHPLAWTLTGGNRNDVTQLLELLDRVPPVRGRIGRPRRRPRMLIADRDDDHDKYRRLVWQRGVKPIIARRQTEHGSGLGRQRWVVERTLAWLHNRRRLLVRTDRREDIHEGFLALACCLICWRRLDTSSE
jgi:transposase